MRSALLQVKEELGADAVIMSNKKVAGGVAIVAAVDNESIRLHPVLLRNQIVVLLNRIAITNIVKCRHQRPIVSRSQFR